MNGFFTKALIFISTTIGVSATPTPDPAWIQTTGWQQVGDFFSFSASNRSLSEQCEKQPDAFVVFPQIILGSQKLIVGETVVASTSDESFSNASPFYNRGGVSCHLIPKQAEVRWIVTSFTGYFARFDRYPRLTPSLAFDVFADVGLNVLAAGALFILSLFALFIFKGKVPAQLYLPLSLGSLSWAIYSAMTSIGFFGLAWSMLSVQKIGDLFVCAGAFFYFSFFRRFNYLSSTEFWIYNVSAALGGTIILFGRSGDAVQFGTTIVVPAALLCFAMILLRAALEVRGGTRSHSLLGIASIFSFAIAGTNDLIHLVGIVPGFMLLPIGAVAGVFFLAVAVNKEIQKIYDERDSLLRELELKVQEKTNHLTEAMESLKKSQADLVQSARLASLGTLSAGLAHEINNSINFVNGALIPLERKVMKSVPDTDRAIVEKLFAAIKEGTSLTVDIVRSLRTFTGMNQAKVATVNVQQIVSSTLTILRNKTKDLKISCEIEDGLSFTGHQVGVNQIVMNLIGNACDAVDPKTGEIKITGRAVGEEVVLEITDNGSGMTPEVAARIFDPFFTTKDVGKGTGLGLHIVKKEVDRHQGSIRTQTAPSQGTTISITFPKNLESLYNTEAAA